MNKTLALFLAEITKHERLKNLVFSNLKTQERVEISINLFELNFDFLLQKLTIQYYVVDDNYLGICLDFSDFVAKYSQYKNMNK
jgi:hypothetical protein